MPSIASQIPAGQDWVPRQLGGIEDRQREQLASFMESINSTVTELQAAQATLAAQQATILAQQAYLSSLISRDAASSTFNTGTLALDSTWHLVGGQAVISGMAVSTGKVRVTVSLSEASIAAASGASVIAAICYAIDSLGPITPTVQYARLYAPNLTIGSSLSRTDVLTVAAGAQTIRAQCAYWAAGSGASSISFSSLRLMAEVIGSD